METQDIVVHLNCPRCLGTGQHIRVNEDGTQTTENPCIVCNGSGLLVSGAIASGTQIGKILNDLKQIKKKLDIKDE